MSAAGELAIPMSRGDVAKLEALNRQRARTAKAGVEQRKAAVLAKAEEQLSSIYKADDEAWRDLASDAERMVADLDVQLAERCRQMGVPEDFRPRLYCGWHGRGENAVAGRRAELRKAAERRVEAEARAAKVRIDEAALEIATQLATAVLTTDQARQFLETMPSVAELMPPVDVRELEAGR